MTGVVLTLLSYLIGLLIPAIILGILSVFTVYFFRDPERRNDAHEKAVLTPADGKILGVRSLKDSRNPLGESAIKVSIFMSIFNVHVNRVPMSGKISKIIYHPGNFFSADLDKASEQNENNRITLETGDGRTIVIVQVAGLIARRIACWIKVGDEVRAGQRFGLIRFGSRLDIYLPSESHITARPGNRVTAGETVLGYLS